MTVVVGFVGPDAAIMCSDSEATESGHTRYDTEKIWTCGGLLMGYTGTAAVSQPLRDQLQNAVTQAFTEAAVPRRDAREVLTQITGQVLQVLYGRHVGARDQHGVPVALNGTLLVIGRDSEGYWLLEIDGMNQATFYEDRGFHTVGSGSAAAYVAQALMKDYNVATREISALRLVAYRTVETCIDSVGGSLGVGGHVQLWESEQNAPFTKCEGERLDAVANGVAQWTTIERESLDKVTEGTPSTTPEEVESAALPEALDADDGGGDEAAARPADETDGADHGR